jgi:hypothetical protein
MFMTHHQNEENNLMIAIKCFRSVAKFKYLGMATAHKN